MWSLFASVGLSYLELFLGVAELLYWSSDTREGIVWRSELALVADLSSWADGFGFGCVI